MSLQNTGGGVAWSKDNGTIFYTTQDAVHRPDKVLLSAFVRMIIISCTACAVFINGVLLQVWRHKIGTDPESDVLVYHETDQSFNVEVYTSRSKSYVFIETRKILRFDSYKYSSVRSWLSWACIQ